MKILKNLNDYVSFVTIILLFILSLRFLIFGLVNHESTISLSFKEIFDKYKEFNDNEEE